MLHKEQFNKYHLLFLTVSENRTPKAFKYISFTFFLSHSHVLRITKFEQKLRGTFLSVVPLPFECSILRTLDLKCLRTLAVRNCIGQAPFGFFLVTMLHQPGPQLKLPSWCNKSICAFQSNKIKSYFFTLASGKSFPKFKLLLICVIFKQILLFSRLILLKQYFIWSGSG